MSTKEYKHKYYLEHKDKWKGRNKTAAHQIANRKYHHKNREIVINAYGGKCACCGETTFEFMSIDHIYGGGYKHRKEVLKHRSASHFYTWVIENKFPNYLRLLCYNCNCSLGHNGYCPHKKED